jgi:hypothetical protein
MKLKYLILIIFLLFVGFNLFFIYIELKDLKSKINTYNEIELTRLSLLDSQISKLNVLIVDLETLLKKTKVPAIE